jgi:hypothetical protein
MATYDAQQRNHNNYIYELILRTNVLLMDMRNTFLFLTHFTGTLMLCVWFNIDIPEDVNLSNFDRFVVTRQLFAHIEKILKMGEVRVLKPIHIHTLLLYSRGKVPCNTRVSVKVEKQLLIVPTTAILQFS